MRALMRIRLIAAAGAALCLIQGLWAQVVISEFQASNLGGLHDEDGDSADWIELGNTGDRAVNLAGWSLTDDPELPKKWEFPSTNLLGGEFMVVFASGKDRSVSGAALHTDFKLAASGEYLALSTPDGRIASEYAPAYPPQADGLGYGLPVVPREVTLLGLGTRGAFLVPTDDTLGTNWTTAGFDDASWHGVATGVGFTSDGASQTNLIATEVADMMRGVNASAYLRLPFVVSNLQELRDLRLRIAYSDGFIAYLNGVPVAFRNAAVAAVGGTLADSITDWTWTDQQGSHNWYYGWSNRALDPDGAYDPHTEFDTTRPSWAWNGAAWVLGPGNPPWDTISVSGWQPNGSNSGGVHWPIRRWISSTSGTITCRIAFAKDNTACGNGATLRVFRDGIQQFAWTAAFNDSIGLRTNLVLQGVQEGECVDFALDPLGTDGDLSDACDGSTFSVTIEQAPSEGITWNSTADTARPETAAGEFEEISLARHQDLLVAGTNVLAIHALNDAPGNGRFWIAPEVTAARFGMATDRAAYFTEVTPGEANGPGSLTLGPIIDQVEHTPKTPSPAGTLIVRARVRQSIRPVASVRLRYRVMFEPEKILAMSDDGQHGDGASGDSMYAARITGGALKAGQMVRYAIDASDSEGKPARAPAFADPTDSPEYFGTVVLDPSVGDSQIAVLHWFIKNPGAADSDTGGRGALFYEGEFYDNILANIHGQSTRAFPKKSYDLHFNRGHKFQWSPEAPKVKSLNLLTTWADKSHMRNILAYEVYRDSGAPGHFAFPVRVQRNGTFYSVANVVESGDAEFLERIGLDSRGALYKMYNAAESVVSAEKKTRREEGSDDLRALISGMGQSDRTTRQKFMYDHLNLPEIISFLAARAITADVDCCHKNYYLYCDSAGSGEWQAMPWDVDLSFGRVWSCGSPCWQYFDETLYTNQALTIGTGNRVFDPIYQTPATRQMFFRRLRTLMDRLVQPPGTPPQADLWKIRTAALREAIAPDAALDLAKWGTWGEQETLGEAVARIWTEFLPGRRAFLFNRMTVITRGEIPVEQPADAVVQIAAIEFRSATGNPAEEWLSITNANGYAVDISDWVLGGGVRFTFKPGTVIPARTSLFVSPDLRAFRARATSPTGGEGRLVVGPYEGNLSAWGESLILTDIAGRLVSSNRFVGEPSPAQRDLRITEIFYNPDPLVAHPEIDPQRYEFVELRNIGASALELRGVRFAKGIQFQFGDGGQTRLEPGARLVVVRDPVAFAVRYGSTLPVAGSFAGILDNAGETIRLEDAFGEKILEFDYQETWHPSTDGQGRSLVFARDVLPWSVWSDPENWRAGEIWGGSPGRGEAGAVQPFPNQLIVESGAGGYRLRYAGEPGWTCELERSLDLVHWQKLLQITVPSGGIAEFIQPSTEHLAVFYRVIERQP